MTPMLRARLVLAASLLASPAFAQSDGASMRTLVKLGQTLEVIDDQGQEVRGRVRSLSADALTLDRKGTQTEIPFQRITQIARPNDNLANGALIGLGAGVAFGLVGATVGTDDCDEVYYECYGGPRFIAAAALVFGAIGAGIGVGVDALIHRERVIYRRDGRRQTRVAPVVGPGVGGAVVSVTW
jgi:hypothetical protein